MMLGIANGIKQRRGRAGRDMPAGALAITAAAMLATSCGFHLAGAGTLPPAMQATFLDSSEPHSDFSDSLRTELRRRGLDLVDSADEAGAHLTISQDSSVQSILSLSARNIPREYEVSYAVTFSLTANGEQLIEPELLVARRSYTYDETQVLAKEHEESILRRALAEDLARQVVRRIEAVTPRPGAAPR
jgi:LPS-assembly lipoprotein